MARWAIWARWAAETEQKNIQDCTEGGTCPCDPSPTWTKILLPQPKNSPITGWRGYFWGWQRNNHSKQIKICVHARVLCKVQFCLPLKNINENEREQSWNMWFCHGQPSCSSGLIQRLRLAALLETEVAMTSNKTSMAPANPLSVFRLLWSHINLHNRSFQATFWTIGRQGRALLLQVLGCAEMEVGKSPRFVGRLVTLCSLRPLKNHCPHCARNKNHYQPCHARRPHSHHGTAQWRCIFQPWSSRDCYWWLPPSQ